jgi:hypothetical protein
MMVGDMLTGDAESFFIPVALDPMPAPSTASRSASGTPTDSGRKIKDKDYFSVPKTSEMKSGSQASTPHIAFQGKFEEEGRTPPADYDMESPQPERPARKLSKRQNGLSRPSPLINDDRKASASSAQSAGDEFKLQEAPRSKKLVGTGANSQSSILADINSSNKNAIAGQWNKDGPATTTHSDSAPLLGAMDKEPVQRTSLDSRVKDEREVRPSLESTGSSTNTIPRKEVPSALSRNGKTFGLPFSCSANPSF